MEEWLNQVKSSVIAPEELIERLPVPMTSEEIHDMEKVVEVYPMRISPYYLGLIRWKTDPIWKQCIPDRAELYDSYGVDDPLNEGGDSPVPTIVHRYPDRALLLVSNQCATYCRFCTRKRSVGRLLESISMDEIREGIEYIGAHERVRDVIISGGDPFLLSDEAIDRILRMVRSAPHVEIIRIDTRTPCTLPQRVTRRLCEVLKRHHPLYINTHFNHPQELTCESAEACRRLADAGIPLGNQTVLLKGVNDDPEVMKQLFQRLLVMRVRPYYLFQCDLTRGTSHFRTSVKRGIGIMDKLVGWTSGLAVPKYVIDAPGGGGKIPLMPKYTVAMDRKGVILRNYRGKIYAYPRLGASNLLLKRAVPRVRLRNEGRNRLRS